MRTLEVCVFKFNELSDHAKEKARTWWRDCETQESGESLLDRDDIEAIATILGITFDTTSVKLMSGGTRQKAKIYFSGFSSQGDGASYCGRYEYAKQCANKIREYAPEDTELHRIADELQAIQRKHFYRVEARMSRSSNSNFYSHSGTMHVDVYLKGKDAPGKVEDNIKQLMRDYADWIYSQLEKEYEYRMSDENVEENINCNEYEFNEDGEIV